MIGLLLSSVSASAILVFQEPITLTVVSIDPRSVENSIGYTLSNDNLTLINTSGGTNYLRWGYTTFEISILSPPFYWEFECNPLGPITNWNGYQGIASQNAITGGEFEAGINPLSKGSLGYRGNGDIWGNSATQIVTGLPTYSAGDILMFAFNPATGGLWVGKNGAWSSDPSTSPPNATSIGAGVVNFRVFAQGREPNEGGTLRFAPGDLSYPVPTGYNIIATPMDIIGAQVSTHNVYTVRTSVGQHQKMFVPNHNVYTVRTSVGQHQKMFVPNHNVYVILEV